MRGAMVAQTTARKLAAEPHGQPLTKIATGTAQPGESGQVAAPRASSKRPLHQRVIRALSSGRMISRERSLVWNTHPSMRLTSRVLDAPGITMWERHVEND